MDEKLRILLCEDDENLGMLLREYLQAKGYSAELYPDGEAGYKAFLKNKYDLCVFAKKFGKSFTSLLLCLPPKLRIATRLWGLRLVRMIISPNRSVWKN